MTSLSNSRWQNNRKERPNRFTNNGDIIEKAKFSWKFLKHANLEVVGQAKTKTSYNFLIHIQISEIDLEINF